MKEGETQVGPPQAERSVDWCVTNLSLQPTSWISGLQQLNLTIGQKTPLGSFADYRFVVVEIDDRDVSAGAKGWKLGFYLLQMKPDDARKLLTIP